MKKELIIAIIIGLSIGLILSYGLYRARKSLQPASTAQPIPSGSPNPSASPNHTLVLLSPEDESVQDTAGTKITGTTKPDSLIVILLNTHQLVTTADSSGNFSVQTNLDPDGNVIAVRAIDEDGTVAEEDRTVIFTTVPFDEAPTASAAATATSSSKIQTKKTTATPTIKPSSTPST